MADTIYYSEKRLGQLRENVESSSLSKTNKKLLLDFERAMQLVEQLGNQRRVRLLGSLFLLARDYFGPDLRRTTITEIKKCLADIESKPLSPWTKIYYKVAIRKFFKWLAYRDQVNQIKKFPPLVSWIGTHLKRKDRPVIKASDLLTEEEVYKLIGAAQSERDRAFVSLIYELGCRIGEIGGMRIKDAKRDQYGYLLELSGKTGHRTPRIVMSDPPLTEWLNHHPMKDDPEAPLWVQADQHGGYSRMGYMALRAVLLRLKAKAGITKRLHAHLFRHTRVTMLLSKGILNETQAKVFFGWAPSSNTVSEYAHLISDDANQAILRNYGIAPKATTKEPEPKTCPRCRRMNAQDAKFCLQCSANLDPAAAFSEDHQREKTDRLLNMIVEDPQIQDLIRKKLAQLEPATLKEFG